MSDDYDMGAQYWRDHAARGPALKPLGKPRHDCAVVDGMYEPLSDDLARQPDDIIEAVCGNWFCHNHGDRACAGNIARVALMRARLTPPSPMGGEDRPKGERHDEG